jgi:uncharacterized protein YciI
VEYFVYGRDAVGGYDIKVRLNEEHWAFMDRYAAEMIARGPTLADDGEETTGSLHILELPDLEAAKKFAFEEPYYRAGAFESVMLAGFRNLSGRTMWEFTEAVDGYGRFLAITMGEAEAPSSKHVILYGDLLDADDQTKIGRAVLLEAPDSAAAASLLEADDRTEIHHWRFGGRPS